MNAPERVKPASKAKFVWEDPLLLGDQLTEEERWSATRRMRMRRRSSFRG